MQDDPLLFDYNVEERVNDFVAAALAQVHSDLTMVMFLLLFLFGFQCTLFAPMYTTRFG
jgi:alpha-mannosidase